MVDQFEEITFEHMPREQNRIPDALATLASLMRLDTDLEVQSFDIKIQDVPAHCMTTEEGIKEKSWFADIQNYLLKQEYPPEASETEKRNVLRLALGYYSKGSTL